MKPMSKSREEIEDWLVQYISKALELSQDAIDPTASFDKFGIESSAAAAMTGDLADWLNLEIDPTVVFEHPTISRLAASLAA